MFELRNEREINEEKVVAVADATYVVAKRKDSNPDLCISRAAFQPIELRLAGRLEEISGNFQVRITACLSQFQAEPKNVVLVHGEAGKMDFLKQKIEKEFGKGTEVLFHGKWKHNVLNKTNRIELYMKQSQCICLSQG